MKQLKTIERIKQLFPKVNGIEVALLYGSFGRKDANPNSDIDIQILVESTFSSVLLIDILWQTFPSEIITVLEIQMRNKIVVYFKQQPKLEIGICKNLSEIDRNYLGSEIKEIAETILYERNPSRFEIENYLKQITAEYNANKCIAGIEKEVSSLIDKFLYEFENASSYHRRSDGYKFYFFYNIALHAVIQLHHLSKGENKFNFLPKNFIANVLNLEEQNSFYGLKGTLFLPEANTQKRRLLDFFYSSIQNLIAVERLNEIKEFCEKIYDRDFLWNFRDISLYNPRIKSGKVFRTSTMTLYQHDNRFYDVISENQIKTIIDLRAEREIEKLPYTEEVQSKFKYVITQFDPWNQPEWFKQEHHQGTNEDIAYRFFALGCKEKIKSAMEAIIDEKSGAVAVHCQAGKDRTGIFVSMLHLLTDAPQETIYSDYLASEVDVQPQRLQLVLDIINSEGGIEPYLLSCGLNENQIQQLKNTLLYGN